jgi:hypothetical protein
VSFFVRFSPVLALVAGCRGPTGVPASSTEVPTPPVVSSTPVAAASAPPTALSATRPSDGCWGLGLPEEPVARLARLGERCAEGQKALYAEPSKVEVEGATKVTLPSVTAGSCVRVAAVSSEVVEVTVSDGSRVVATDRGAAFALAPSRGPVCVRAAGALVATVTRKTPGAVWVQAWATE